MEKSISIFYFPKAIRLLAGLGMLTSIYFLFQQQLFIAAGLFLAGAFVLTARYVTSVNINHKVIQDYFTFCGIKSSKEEISYSVLEKIAITKQQKGYTANSRSRERQVKWSQFDAHLIYDDQKSFKLLTENSKSELLKNLTSLIAFLGLQVEDQTAHVPF